MEKIDLFTISDDTTNFNSIQDELQKFYNLISQNTKRSLDIYVNNYCNVNCSFCIGRIADKKRNSIKYNFFTIYNYIKNYANNYDTITFTGGGEPFLDFDVIYELLPLIKEKEIIINTNGTLLEREFIVNELSKYNVKIIMNFQGFNNVWQNQNPIYFKTINDFDKFGKNLRKIRDKLLIKIVINKLNYKNLSFVINDVHDFLNVNKFIIVPDFTDFDLLIDLNNLQIPDNIQLSFNSKCEHTIDVITYKHNVILSGNRCESCIINNNDNLDLSLILEQLKIMNNFIENTCINCKAFKKTCLPCYCHFATFNIYKNTTRFSNCEFHNSIGENKWETS